MERHAIVICGGLSRRMESDKALIEYNGNPMLIHHVHAFLERGWNVVVAGVDERRIDLLKGMAITTIPIENEQGKRGPVRGILSGLGMIPKNEWIQLSPCDAPHLIDTIMDMSVMEGWEEITMPIWRDGDEWRSEPLWASGPKDMLLHAILEYDGPLHKRFKDAGCTEQMIALPDPGISSLNTKKELEMVENTIRMEGEDLSIHRET